MSRSLRQPQEPTHEGRGREEEDPREAEVHVNRRANGVNTSNEPVNARQDQGLGEGSVQVVRQPGEGNGSLRQLVQKG